MSRIAVVIPMYGKEEYTRKCIQLVKDNYGTGEPIEIVVVDDASPTPFVDPLANVVRLDTNLGFTGAANEGLLWAQYRNCDYVMLLNNDTEPEPDFLKHLVDFMESNPVVGIAGSVRILNVDSKYNVELYGADLIRGYQQMTDMETAQSFEKIFVHWVPLCSALIRMDCLREIGLLDKHMRTWCSDADLCFRANFGGWNVALVPKSIVKHHHQVTTGKNIEEAVGKDQRVALEKMSGMQYAKLMKELPLDCHQKTYGKILFEVEKR